MMHPEVERFDTWAAGRGGPLLADVLAGQFPGAVLRRVSVSSGPGGDSGWLVQLVAALGGVRVVIRASYDSRLGRSLAPRRGANGAICEFVDEIARRLLDDIKPDGRAAVGVPICLRGSAGLDIDAGGRDAVLRSWALETDSGVMTCTLSAAHLG